MQNSGLCPIESAVAGEKVENSSTLGSFNETTYNDLIKYIFQVESLNDNGEISIKDTTIFTFQRFLKSMKAARV